ncbi:uridine diphosphate glucose pyrophosphatase NUDT14-like [Drosophila nasuta]|uniref:uridine diphosphate glucose pyrophosphatase NUDT14-like n=1 Tax=Drosophila nasuta TaxID=42062 RepID=UPI00295EEE7F|nr:uridine diphosphate glucose pyrophosphatase NUDT14-like [Drosophila nasuta]
MFKYLIARASRYLSTNVCQSAPLSDITKVWFTPLPKDAKWVAPLQMHYIENGMKKDRDIVKIFNGVMVVLFNVSRQKLIYVRQFRPAVYHGLITGNSFEMPKGCIDLVKYPPEIAVTLEPCAGVAEINKSPQESARVEVLEECGYDVPTESLQLIYQYRSGVGASSAAQTLFYCEVCDEQKVNAGGGVHDEVIEVVDLSIEEAKEYVKTGATVSGGPSTLLATLWFLSNKA